MFLEIIKLKQCAEKKPLSSSNFKVSYLLFELYVIVLNEICLKILGAFF